jgi:hypothetical protein
MLAQGLGIAAIPFGFRDRKSLVLARPEQDQNGGCKESLCSQAYPQTKFAIGLELVTMAGSADTLKVVWIASF